LEAKIHAVEGERRQLEVRIPEDIKQALEEWLKVREEAKRREREKIHRVKLTEDIID
jgi:predicted DNA-binding antitoxin AbrB/MazE fold protein